MTLSTRFIDIDMLVYSNAVNIYLDILLSNMCIFASTICSCNFSLYDFFSGCVISTIDDIVTDYYAHVEMMYEDEAL